MNIYYPSKTSKCVLSIRKYFSYIFILEIYKILFIEILCFIHYVVNKPYKSIIRIILYKHITTNSD